MGGSSVKTGKAKLLQRLVGSLSEDCEKVVDMEIFEFGNCLDHMDKIDFLQSMGIESKVEEYDFSAIENLSSNNSKTVDEETISVEQLSDEEMEVLDEENSINE